jgi:hypothetical protein
VCFRNAFEAGVILKKSVETEEMVKLKTNCIDACSRPSPCSERNVKGWIVERALHKECPGCLM